MDGDFPSTLKWAETHFAPSDRFSIMTLDEVLRSSRVVVSEAYINEPEASNPLKSELAGRRVWTEGVCVKMDPRSPEEFEAALVDAIDKLPSKDDVLVHFVETPFDDLKEELSVGGESYLKVAKRTLEGKGVPCTIFSEKSGNLIKQIIKKTIY